MADSEQFDYAGAIANQPLGGREMRFPTFGYTDAVHESHLGTPFAPVALNVLTRLPYDNDFCGGTRPGLVRISDRQFADPQGVFVIPWKGDDGVLHEAVAVISGGFVHVIDGTVVESDRFASTDDALFYITTEDGRKIVFTEATSVRVDGSTSAGCVLGEHLYFFSGDGVRRYEPRTGDVVEVSRSAFGATSMCFWRGRLVLFGADNVAYLSAELDPSNFDFGADSSVVTRAWAMQLNDAGRIGDTVTAFVPYSNTLALAATRHELWLVASGDGGLGQSRISREVGIVRDSAWCIGDGEVAFLSQDGLHFWNPEGGVSSLNQSFENGMRRSCDEISRPDLSKAWRLAYDRSLRGYCLFNETSFWFVDETRAIWPFSFDASIWPKFAARVNEGRLSAVFVGADGRLRSFGMSDSQTDDGLPFGSILGLGAVSHTTGGTEDAFLAELDCEMGPSSASSGVYVSCFRGRNAKESVEKVRAFSESGSVDGEVYRHSVSAGWNPVMRPRARCNSLAAAIWSESGRFLFTKLTAVMRGCGRIRRR